MRRGDMTGWLLILGGGLLAIWALSRRPGASLSYQMTSTPWPGRIMSYSTSPASTPTQTQTGPFMQYIPETLDAFANVLRALPQTAMQPVSTTGGTSGAATGEVGVQPAVVGI